MMEMVSARSVLALDVGGKRIGVATASLIARLPRPLTTLDATNYLEPLRQIITQEAAAALVVGLPRGLDGQSTAQTDETEAFAKGLRQLGLPIYFQDESVTSKKAQAELEARGRPYKREEVDALAASYILEDWLSENKEINDL
jgi:putative holliday junction resolvase